MSDRVKLKNGADVSFAAAAEIMLGVQKVLAMSSGGAFAYGEKCLTVLHRACSKAIPIDPLDRKIIIDLMRAGLVKIDGTYTDDVKNVVLSCYSPILGELSSPFQDPTLGDRLAARTKFTSALRDEDALEQMQEGLKRLIERKGGKDQERG
ncbi:hypothetical protein [Fimbriiglobus ruber]|uniref:Uncharacterized protein n=1 Tax=Fimbriiglobus ruber TaxID=1908690 RepID=A0A225EDH2_9BACT|nr:hypothetical protein [Fimbriiglobus ruber]OWK46475.1 hypothetical protein FRUB_00174 [Fimbriiglobus ruber]